MEFDQYCQQRHEQNETKLENDPYEEICRNLADISNYARYEYIKVRLMQTGLGDSNAPQLGPDAFTPVGGDAIG